MLLGKKMEYIGDTKKKIEEEGELIKSLIGQQVEKAGTALERRLIHEIKSVQREGGDL